MAPCADSGCSDRISPGVRGLTSRHEYRVFANSHFCVTIMTSATRVVEYVDAQGRSPYAAWFNNLSAEAAAKVTTALYRLEAGNFSNIKGVGGGVFERRLDYGPGYRIYFGKDGDRIVVLLGGSTKRRQVDAIAAAQKQWADYKRRKSGLQEGK
jgi:putative addiction module killer protein